MIDAACGLFYKEGKNMKHEVTIDGKVYRLVEEEKKPERLEGWITSRVYLLGNVAALTRSKDIEHDDTRMIEIREGEVIVSRDDVINAFRKSGYTSLIGYPESLLKEQLAEKLNGIEYREYALLEDLAKTARDHGLIILIGASDDYAELYGSFRDEAHGLYDGGEIVLHRFAGVYQNSCDNDDCPHESKLREQCSKIKAIWCPKDAGGKIIASWSYETDIPHSVFDVMEDSDIYCKAIVFSLKDLK